MKPNGEFELFCNIEGRRRGTQYEDKHFSYTEKDTILINTAWEKDLKGVIKQIAKYKDRGLLIDNKLILTDTTTKL